MDNLHFDNILGVAAHLMHLVKGRDQGHQNVHDKLDIAN